MLLSIDFENLHQILHTLYQEMMPLCSNLTGVAKGIAGLGALFYVAAKVWQALARAEPIDVYPLLRPFAIGLCIMFFPTFVLGTINTVLSPVVKGCHGMLETQTFDMNKYREQKDKLEFEANKRNPETAYLVDKEEFDKKLDELGWSAGDLITMGGMYIDRAEYRMKQNIRRWFQELLELLFQSAGLVIDTIRTFFLIVLSILGPIAFAISVYDGFQSTLTQWITRYISVYMWLPVSDLFSSVLARIQVLMLTKDIEAMSDPTFIPDSNTVYMVFLIIGIFGYFTIPTVANWIIMAGGVSGANRAMNTTAQSGECCRCRGGCCRGECCRKTYQVTKKSRKEMEFKSLKNIETSFRQIRLFALVFICLCAVVTGFALWKSYSFAEAQRQKIYVLDNGKSLMLALSQDVQQNRPVEAREHVRRFHELFFTLSPDKSAIEGNIKRSLMLADKSAFNYYKDLSEKGYYNRVISGNINQMVQIDSVRCDFDKYPYNVRTFARQIILRESSVTERSLVTRCRLLDAVRSDNNPQGFIIEGFEITENKDLQTIKR